MEQQFSRNIPSLSKEEQALLAQKHVLVAGCGGLGGYAVELLTRLGVGKLTIADCDDFEESNLNRQLYATHATLRKSKIFVAQERVKAIHPATVVRPWSAKISESTVDTALQGVDLVIDALDNKEGRLLLEYACSRANIPMVHGAAVGWCAQVMVVLPGSGSLRTLYRKNAPSMSRSTLAMTPALCASLQVGEAVKLLCGRRSDLENRVLAVDLEGFTWRVVSPEEEIFPPKMIRVVFQKNGAEKEELQVPQNTTVREILHNLNYQLDYHAKGYYITCGNKLVLPEEEGTTYVEDGEILSVHKGALVGG